MFKKRRKSSTAFLYGLTLFLLQALILFLALIFGGKNAKGFNEWVYQHALISEDKALPVRLGAAGELAQDITITAKRKIYTCPTVYTLRLDAATLQDTLLGKDDYSPQDIAVALKQIEEAEIKSLALSSPLHWDLPEGDMGMISLLLAFQGHQERWLGLRGQMSTLADFTPECLQSSLIPLKQVRGDVTALPQANKVMPNALLESEGTSWAVDLIVGEQLMSQASPSGTKGYPLIARWNGEIFPTLALRMAMDMLKLSPQDIQIELGKSLQLGSRSIPIDDAGRSILKESQSSSISLGQILDGEAKSMLQNHCLIIEHSPKDSHAPEYRLDILAQTLSQLIAEESSETYTKHKKANYRLLQYMEPAEHQKTYLLAGIILLFYLLLLPKLPRSLCYSIYLFILPVFIFFAVQYTAGMGQWFNVGAVLSLWLALLLFTPMRWKPKR